MNIVLPARWKKYVRARIAAGQYDSESDVLSAALKLLETRDAQIDRLRRDIEDGRNSGKPRAFDAEGIKRRGRARLAARSK
jgi:antitoxin ParD1/3/4